jgi:hypothetical protein
LSNNYLAYGEKILLTLWVGGMWFAGYVVAPILFQTLDRVTAGMVAGQVFTVTSYLGLACGLFLILGLLVSRSRGFRLWTLLIMLCIIMLGQFVLAPMMLELKQAGIPEGSDNASDFARLHGLSSILYLVNSILGLVLIISSNRADRPEQL